ncbi:DinB family protein [Metabacillus arenae]|nr:DinB family protein [Metabacillus arenae]
MDPIAGMLYSMVEGNFHRLKSIVKDMDQEELDYKGPNHIYNSTAQLLRHLAFVDLNWIYRIKNEPMPKSLNEKYGPMVDENNQIPLIKGISLEKLLNDYDEIFHMLKGLCFCLTDNDLKKTVEYEGGKKATVQWGLWHIADHNRYHQAHINQLRKWFLEQ